MSLNIIKKNSSSPFNQQRSMVNQSGSGGAYESGGYDPNNTYGDNNIASAIVGFGTSVGAGLGSITAGDRNEQNIAKSERLKQRKAKISGKNANDPRIDKINKKILSTEEKIESYKEYYHPTKLEEN